MKNTFKEKNIAFSGSNMTSALEAFSISYRQRNYLYAKLK